MDLGVEDGEALPVGEQVGVRVRQPDDQPFQPQPAQVIAAAGLSVGLVKQRGDQRPRSLLVMPPIRCAVTARVRPRLGPEGRRTLRLGPSGRR
jgi:hypothetical protein